LQNLPSILVLRVSRALELRIGLRVKPRAELRAELKVETPLDPPAHCVLHSLRGQYTGWAEVLQSLR